MRSPYFSDPDFWEKFDDGIYDYDDIPDFDDDGYAISHTSNSYRYNYDNDIEYGYTCEDD